MDYRPRQAERRLRRLAERYKVVLVTGPRQSGKTALLRRVFPGLKLLTLDPVEDRYGARRDPGLFLGNFPPPVVLDEIQFAPELLPALARRVEESNSAGQYLLAGAEEMGPALTLFAGRAAVLRLDGLNPHELARQGDRAGWLEAYFDAPDSAADLCRGAAGGAGPLARQLWRGSLPGLLDRPDELVADFHRACTQTLLERDIRRLEAIRDAAAFGRFLGLAGALSGGEVNASVLGREAGVTPATARRWLDLLARTFQWVELPPYAGKSSKRLSRRPWGFLHDTGLACSLQRLGEPDALAVSPRLGPLFRSWVAGHLLRQAALLDPAPAAYHWRTSAGAQVELLFERQGRLYPIAIACKSRLSKGDTRGLRAFRATYPRAHIAHGLVLYAGTECQRLDGETTALPWNAAAVKG